MNSLTRGAAMLMAHAIVCSAGAQAASGLMIMNARALASIPGAPTSVVYLSVHNAGGSSDRLVSASTPLARKVEFHSSSLSQGVVSMRPLAGVNIAVGSMVEFRNGGNHLMLVGLLRPLVAGTKLPLTLHFQKAGDLTVMLPVEAHSPAAPPAHHARQ
jgi:copper(I)-binding protein